MLIRKSDLLLVLGGAAVLLCGTLVGLAHESGFAVKVAGETVAVVSKQSAVERTVKEIAAEKQKEIGLPVRCTTEAQYKEVSLKAERAASNEELKKVLAEKFTYEAEGVGIVVNGQTAAVLKSEALAQKALERVKTDAKAELEKDGRAKVKEVDIKEHVVFKKVWTPLSQLKSPQAAAKILRAGADKTVKYKVVQGDTLWGIARSHGMTVEELQQANPQLTSEHLSLGQELNLLTIKPFLTVRSVEVRVADESIPFKVVKERDSSLYSGTQKIKVAGKNGIKEVTWQIVRENGNPVKKQPIKEIVALAPQAQVVLVGTKEVPSRGSGRFMWPLRGRINSPFGTRWGHMHEGIDIDASIGTAVHAADNGRVVFAGRRSGYGKLVIIDHGNGFTTRYGHLSSILVSNGQRVRKGQIIARTGNTGRSTGPHLHFEIRMGGSPKNPLRFI